MYSYQQGEKPPKKLAARKQKNNQQSCPQKSLSLWTNLFNEKPRQIVERALLKPASIL
jgi:hypothetical protein